MKPLDVMVLESSPHVADDTVHRLEEAGHRVHRCHGADLPAFPCNAIRAAAGCPLAGGVDVALVVNASAEREPTTFEEGVGCALRAHVPLVEEGLVEPSPFTPWVAARVGVDLEDALRKGVEAGYDSMRQAIRFRLEPVLADAGIDGGTVQIQFDRRGRDMSVSIIGPIPPQLASSLAVRVGDAIRDSGRQYDRLNIAVG